MALVEMVMPKMGESVMEGTVLSWLKQVGDTIEEEESLLEVATDKVDTDIPASHAGVLKEILAQEGDVVEVGKPIARIETTGEASTEAPSSTPDPEKEPVKAAEQLVENAISTVSDEPIPAKSGDKFFSPLVRNIAKEEGVTVAELEALQGSGKDGRVTKKDILAYVDQKKSGTTAPSTATTNGQTAQTSVPKMEGVPATISGEDEIIEMDRMRKMIADRMLASKQISPHVTSFVEADVSEMVQWRNKMKGVFKERDGQILTFTPIMIEAVVKAIKDYPMINVQVDGNRIIRKKHINIGMAVALPTGNLIVPVIHDADQLNLVGLTQKVNELARKARENKLKPDDLQGGTYTVSNVGSFGNVMGTPIIMQPQVGIMALGAIVKKPAVVETPQGDFIGIRHKMFLSHSYDHRVVDGALGGMFVRRVADYLERFDKERTV
ncbi:dihydrolipoamide acetyltransferase family protein [Marinoscillum furvescens]|uniref:Dihydrolipoamide acetyltransferase component of pyruvate dehydrogenase complex n=1 Tax=Marinoscillum furvescens DSM 4134 TaxID=1122208 RepID=A0A3D9L8B4_MARFU|nr:dihydrolipoamide acetyltransferase family protein [Marinoscillum furvescens]REE02080.1 2-oxoglutarate dehydrogenase E2 component (dihydrolipoamide succinyltransferase) [Marinoscillum furvescens DSM 4134]